MNLGKKSYELEADEGLHARRVTNAYMKVLNEYPTESDVQEITAAITYIKNMMLTDNEIKKLDKKYRCPIHDIFNIYETSLKNDQMIDYDDQMVYTYNISQ